MKIQELLPRLKKGWVAMDEDKCWHWFEIEPEPTDKGYWAFPIVSGLDSCELYRAFDIDPFDGDWENSLMKCGEKK